jgi:hypothetical protein
VPYTLIIGLQDLNPSIAGPNAYKTLPRQLFHYQAIHYVSTQQLFQNLIFVKPQTI